MPADVTIEAAADEAKTTRALRVSNITREAQDIASFELLDPLGLELPPFTAGAHLDVRINDYIRRQYSLCNDPQERDRYVIAVLNEPAGRGGSRAMHEQIAVGSVLLVSTPRNRFPLAGREARVHLLLAGGIGVTPMLAMIAELERRTSPWHMHYCTRSPARTAFLDRLRPLIAAGKVELHHGRRRPGGRPRYRSHPYGLRSRNARLFLRPARLHACGQGQRLGLAALQRALRVFHRGR